MARYICRAIFLLASLVTLVSLSACGGGGSGSEGSGTLVLGLTDAATDDYQAIYVTIAEVQVNKGAAEDEDEEAGWQTILTPDTTYNLLELVNGVIETLGIAELAAGKYNQMRLILGELPDENLGDEDN